MKDLIIDNNNKVLVSSKDISDAFGKVHRNVMRDINSLDCSNDFRLLNFERTSYTSIQNKVLPCYNMTRDGFSFLCMGFTGVDAAKWKERYINAFNKMESAIAGCVKTAPKSMEALNEISKRIEGLNDVGSFHGRGLAMFKRDKQVEQLQFESALSDAQLTLRLSN